MGARRLVITSSTRAAPSGVVRSALFPKCVPWVCHRLSDLQCLRALRGPRYLIIITCSPFCVPLGLRRYYIKPFLVREQKENRKGIKLFKDAFERKVKLMNDMK